MNLRPVWNPCKNKLSQNIFFSYMAIYAIHYIRAKSKVRWIQKSEIWELMYLTAMLGHVGAVEMYLRMATPEIVLKRKKQKGRRKEICTFDSTWQSYKNYSTVHLSSFHEVLLYLSQLLLYTSFMKKRFDSQFSRKIRLLISCQFVFAVWFLCGLFEYKYIT